MLASRYREEQAEYIAEGINVLYTEDNIQEHLQAVVYQRRFLTCMRDEMIGLIPGTELIDLFNGDVVSYIKGKAWGALAEYLAPKLVKLGFKSNVAGIVAQLGVGAGKCAIFE